MGKGGSSDVFSFRTCCICVCIGEREAEVSVSGYWVSVGAVQ